MNPSRLTPASMWEPLPKAEWSESAARHLCLRLGFSLQNDWLREFQTSGPAGVLQKTLGSLREMPPPQTVVAMADGLDEYRSQMKQANPAEKSKIRQSLQKANRATYADFGVHWLRFARNPACSAQEKLILFFQDVWVVSFAGVRSSPAILDYQQRIRRSLSGSYPQMCKELGTSAAMIRYLNLNQNRKDAPNENFARELFELFVLGEGHYTEKDVREAARALTGYVVNPAEEVYFRQPRFDNSRKTIFGKTGNFNFADVIDLAFQQPAAARFLPRELVRFYLSEEDFPTDWIQPLADEWKTRGYSIPFLISTFFSSRLFYHESYRGNFIKSPVHFYLGLLQDLELDVFPSPRMTTNSLRSMGQAFFNPPNVRGWVGGRHWINSATLMARGEAVRTSLYPPRQDRLNADEQAALEEAKAAGHGRFKISEEWIRDLEDMSARSAAEWLSNRLYVNPDPEPLARLLKNVSHSSPRRRAMEFLTTALTAPAYHLS